LVKDQILRAKMPELDSLRGVAILSVLLYHGLFWSNKLAGLSGLARIAVNLTRFGWLGVNLFFVLSGFLITGILIRLNALPNYYSKFYSRRALRILPALYALLFLLCLVPHQSYKFVLLSFFFIANLAPLLHVVDSYPMLWSLAVEEHFYLLWPMAVRRLGTRFLYLVSAIIFCGTPALRALSFSKPSVVWLNFSTLLVCDGFAVGALLALVVREPWMSRRHLRLISCSALALAALALAIGAPFGILTRAHLLGATFMLSVANVIFFAVLGLSIWCGSGARASLVHWRILRFYGDISYGLYLCHWLVFLAFDWMLVSFWPSARATLGVAPFTFLRCGVVLLFATGLAYISRWYYEERFLRLGLAR
jgi:peptidoglycan/LPS O-acetylase OafA/YrhL